MSTSSQETQSLLLAIAEFQMRKYTYAYAWNLHRDGWQHVDQASIPPCTVTLLTEHDFAADLRLQTGD